MYSDEDKRNMYNYQNYDEEGNYSNRKKSDSVDIIIKIVLIVLCVLALIWLFNLLKGSNKEETVVYVDDSRHNSNVAEVRLAAERHFFINNNLPEGNNVKTISLQTLINEQLLNSIVDSNNKVCDNTKSVISLNKDGSYYLMRINLSCSTKEKEEKFYYDYVTYNCVNCDGKTYMEGNTKEEEPDEESEDEPSPSYSCTEWSEWQETKVNDASLTERTRTLVRGIKRGTKKVTVSYGDWSEYTTTPARETENLEVETKKVQSGTTTKTVTKSKKEPDKVEKTCPSGYTKEGDKCYSKVKTGDLTYKEFALYDVSNRDSVEIKTEKNSEGKYALIYKNCVYRIVNDLIETVVPGKTVTYEEEVSVPSYVTYYRTRTVTREVISEGDIITDDYYEEDKLPKGYEKYPGSEKIEYSYKLTTCVK